MNATIKRKAGISALTIGLCGFLMWLYSSENLPLAPLTLIYLIGCYTLFLAMSAAAISRALKRPILKGVLATNGFITLVIGSCLVVILNEFSHHREAYHGATILAYGLLLFHLIRFFEKGERPPIKYLLSGILVAAIFFMSPTMDKSDPYGPHFQLRVVFWLLLLHLAVSWVLDQWKTIKQLENERTEAQLRHLKSQINPHFLFNTLNNLYGLAEEKADETPDLIIRLSEMMRYTLYQGDRDRVSLDSEIAYLDNYLSLSRVRLHQRGEIEFQHHADRTDYQIAPLMLIILVENAFKHGLENIRESARVHIRLEAREGRLRFTVENNVNPDKEPTTPGIGLDNLRKRLELTYPSCYDLKICSEETNYRATLEIQLEEKT